MRTTPLNTYRVTFHYTVEIEAVHEDEAYPLASSTFDAYIKDRDERNWIVGDMDYTVELIDGTEPGQED